MDININEAFGTMYNASKVAIVESSPCVDGSWIAGTILADRIAKKDNVLLILHHHGFGHYQGIGVKLGFNLQSLKDNGKLEVIDVMDEIVRTRINSADCSGLLQQVLTKILKQSQSYVKSCQGSVTVVVDHPGNVGIAFDEWPMALHYTRYLQALASRNSSIIYVTGPSGKNIDIVNACYRHYCDVTAFLRGLATGSATDISGSLEIIVKEGNCKNEYHFQLLDKRVRLFAPGTVQFR